MRSVASTRNSIAAARWDASVAARLGAPRTEPMTFLSQSAISSGIASMWP